MPTSSSYNYTTSRDGIITRALRIVGLIQDGETPSTSQITSGAEALNDVVKEWAADGMPLWAVKTSSAITLVAGTNSYAIGIGATINQNAPLKIHQAWLRNVNTNYDRPLLIVTREEYQRLGDKSAQGTVNQLWYNPPGPITGTENSGTISLYNNPNSDTATNYRLWFSGQYPFQDFDAAADVPDFPQYWYNAVKWGLADQLSYEAGLGLSERAMISKKALQHKDAALSFGVEEGSVWLRPTPQWDKNGF